MPGTGTPASAYAAAMIGAAALVPPSVIQPWLLPYVSCTAIGPAEAAMSLLVRRGQPVSVCHGGLVTWAEHPEPEVCPWPMDHTVSFHPRALDAAVSVVPPTAVTYWETAGASSVA